MISLFGIAAEAQLKSKGEMMVTSAPLMSLKHYFGFFAGGYGLSFSFCEISFRKESITS